MAKEPVTFGVTSVNCIRDDEDPQRQTWECALEDPLGKNRKVLRGLTSLEIKHPVTADTGIITTAYSSKDPMSCYKSSDPDLEQWASLICSVEKK